MHLPSTLLSLLLTLSPPTALAQPVVTTPVARSADPGPATDSSSSSCGRRNTPRYCAGTNYTLSLLHVHLCGDSRLGPTYLPARTDDLPVAPALAAALAGYDRLGGLCPGDFVRRWFDEGAGWWRYPPLNGFLVADDGAPGAGPAGDDGAGDGEGDEGAAQQQQQQAIAGNVTLGAETLLDRFGSEFGTFVSPAGAPYAQRALPPSNLAWAEGQGGVPYNYHIYSVVKPLVVLAGPIAPWFGQPGAGVQYMLYKNVATLIEEGYLRREDPSVLLF